eukprot:scaffold2581_cov84-Skeletonema_dohrnii-CCMP3373.AAC.5
MNAPRINEEGRHQAAVEVIGQGIVGMLRNKPRRNWRSLYHIHVMEERRRLKALGSEQNLFQVAARSWREMSEEERWRRYGDIYTLDQERYEREMEEWRERRRNPEVLLYKRLLTIFKCDTDTHVTMQLSLSNPNAIRRVCHYCCPDTSQEPPQPPHVRSLSLQPRVWMLLMKMLRHRGTGNSCPVLTKLSHNLLGNNRKMVRLSYSIQWRIQL